MRVAAALALLSVASLAAAAADQAPSSEPRSSQLQVGGFIDGVFAYNFNKPGDHANFFPGVGTSGKRDNELSINLAELDVSLAPKPVGFKLSVGFGTGTEVVHGAELKGVATEPAVWRHVVQASMQWQTALGRGLLLEAGVFPCHVGLEAFQSKENWNYTRSWLGELSPYYSAGLKVSYPWNDHWSAQLHILNGWQVIADNNRGKTAGAQLAYSSDTVSLSLNGMVGPELPDDDSDIRALGDLVWTCKVRPSLSLGASVDVAREGRALGPAAGWKGVGLYVRLAPPQSQTAVALRGEYYDDKDGAISGVAQTLKEVTATLEHRPAPHLTLKLEGRYDRSSAPVFSTEERAADGAPLRKRDQFLLLLGAVASF